MLILFLFALVPLCAVGISAIRTAEELILNMATNQLEHVMVDKAALLERWITERNTDLEVMAGTAILSSMDPERIGPYLELIRSKYKVYGEIAVVSPRGQLIYSSSGRPLGPEARDGIRASLTGGRYLSDIALDPVKKESYFWISAPLAGASSEIAGAVCAKVGTGTILSDILRVSLGETGECYLVNRNGTFLAHKEPIRILTQNIAQSESFKSIFGASKRGITYIDYRGIRVIGTSTRIAGTDWILVVEQDRDEAFHSADALGRYVLLVITLSICGALLSAWLLSRYVANPIRRLSEAAHQLARGAFDGGHLHTTRADEIGMLYGAFADMARRLQERQHSLEERVTLRETELKETDVKLKQTQEAAVRSHQLASLGQLAAGVAHEIRTPLTSLKMFLESIEAEITIAPEYEEDFGVAMSQIQRMEATIHRFLDFARPQAPLFTEVDVRELIVDALLVVGPRAKQQETLLHAHVEEALPTLRGDRKQLGEALLNLLVNGLEAIGIRGELTVTAVAGSSSGAQGERDVIRVEIADTGPGIREEHLSTLFDPFFTTKANGTGLGLSIVDSTVRRHGGAVRVESATERGTTFCVTLPVERERVCGADGKDTDR